MGMKMMVATVEVMSSDRTWMKKMEKMKTKLLPSSRRRRRTKVSRETQEDALCCTPIETQVDRMGHPLEGTVSITIQNNQA